MKRIIMVGLLVLILVTSIGISLTTAQPTHAEGDEDDTFGACAKLTVEAPHSEECLAEIAAHPLPELDIAIEFDATRDGKAHPRSIFLPEEPFQYPLGWQKRNWYFSDAPGVLPADNDWTNARLISHYSNYFIYKSLKVGNDVWHLIGPDQWMKDEFVSVLQMPEKPEEVDTLWVAIDLEQQTLIAFNEDDEPIFTTLVSTGYWYPTPEGLFHIYARTLSTTLIGPPGANPPVYVLPHTPWVMFYHEHRALHGAPFHNYLGMNRSHGSINLAPGDAEWVWNFFAETEEEWDPADGENFFVDNLDAAPWVYVYFSPEIPITPEW